MHQTAADLFDRVVVRLTEWGKRLGTSLDQARELSLDLGEQMLACTPPEKQITTGSAVEVSILSPADYAAFHREHSLPLAEVVDKVAGEMQRSATDVLRNVAHAKVRTAAEAVLVEHFWREIRSTSITDFMDRQLAAGGASAERMTRLLGHVVQACQPSWSVVTTRAGMVFGDVVMVAAPPRTDRVQKAMLTLLQTADAGLNADARYQAEATLSDCSTDPHRIVVMRRCHGGLPHYLATSAVTHRLYQDWQTTGHHCVHTMPARLIARMPGVHPTPPSTRPERAAALAYALGWFVRRGGRYHINVSTRGDNGSTSFQVPMVGHEACLTMTEGQLRPPVGAWGRMVDAGKLVFEGRDETLPETHLADDLAGALRTFAQDPQRVDQVNDLLDSMKSAVSNRVVAKELSEFVEELADRPRNAQSQQVARRRTADPVGQRTGSGGVIRGGVGTRRRRKRWRPAASCPPRAPGLPGRRSTLSAFRFPLFLHVVVRAWPDFGRAAHVQTPRMQTGVATHERYRQPFPAAASLWRGHEGVARWSMVVAPGDCPCRYRIRSWP